MAVLPIVSLCTGGGGLDRGVALAVRPARLRPVLYVEVEAFSAAYLVGEMEEGRMAEAPVWSDLATIPCGVLEDLRALARRCPVALCAGFSCQPWSSAGQRKGTEDERWLWPAIAAVVGMVRPGLIVLENVPGLARGGLGHVLRDLALFGYGAAWACCRASDIGAPHRRERLFLVAVAERWRDELEGDGPRSRERGDALADSRRSRRRADERGERAREPDAGRSCDNLANTDRLVSGADTRGTDASADGRYDARGGGPAVADTDREGPGRERRTERDDDRQDARGDLAYGCGHGLPRYPPGPQDLYTWRALLADRPWLAPALDRETEAEAERALRVVAHGLVAGERRDMLRLAGNGVVPEQAAVAIRALLGSLLQACETTDRST